MKAEENLNQQTPSFCPFLKSQSLKANQIQTESALCSHGQMQEGTSVAQVLVLCWSLKALDFLFSGIERI